MLDEAFIGSPFMWIIIGFIGGSIISWILFVIKNRKKESFEPSLIEEDV